MDYNQPEKLIERTVRQVFESVLYAELSDSADDHRELRPELKKLAEEAEQKINYKVAELKNFILNYAPTVKNISYEPQIDFSRGFQSGDFKVNEGKGEHYLDKSGDGTKRKIYMATIDWDRQVTLSMQAEGGSLPDIIRAYDEPDTNLDYQAQRHLYKSISEIVSNSNTNTQAIICTHSPRMIDKAPAQKIRMLKEVDGQILVEQIQASEDEEVEAFLTGIARELGITNSLMFYENCFIIVEGETEENALPFFYRTLHGHSMLEDGIHIINVRGKGAFKEFLRLLSRNKQELVIILMDTDCAATNDDKLTEEVLRESGFTDEFCQKRVKKVGRQEFEDLFAIDILIQVFNNEWPKENGELWNKTDFSTINPDQKYSDQLKGLVWNYCGPNGNRWSKPELGNNLGRICEEGHIPEDIKNIFILAREIANSL